MSTDNVLRKSTPILVVERIEPVLAFWRRLGVEVVNKVPDGEGADAPLGFAILAGSGIELMYQTVRSVAADLIASSSVRTAYRTEAQQGYLFIEVPNLAEIEKRLAGERLVLPHRTTFYGAKELGYADPAGNIVVFAEFAASAA